jgi:MtrB/PioB family decaheme-associated outer membrane protein
MMTKHIALGLAVLASASMLPLIAAAQDKGGGFDVSDSAPAAAAQTAASATDSVPVASNEVTVGVGGVTESNATFGRYNGMPKDGVGGLASWNVVRRDAWGSGGTHYFTSSAENLNVGFGKVAPEARVDLKIGEQGKWWIQGDYDAMTYTASDNFHTLLDKEGNLAPGFLTSLINAGAFVNNLVVVTPNASGSSYITSTNGNLPGKSFYPNIKAASGSTGIASGAPAFPATSVAAYGGSTSNNELVYNIGTRRDKGAVSAGFELGDWLITSGVSHEHKEGTLEQTMTTGGNNAGMMAFAMPINYDTDVFNISAAYNTETFQAVVSYEFSNFRDNNSRGFGFQGWNFTEVRTPGALPTTANGGNGTGLAGTTSYTYNAYELNGDYSLPPSNQAHNVTAEIGYNFTPTTRLNVTGVYGLQLQNDPFDNATNNAYTLANTSKLALNPSSLNGYVQTWFGNATLTSRPFHKLDLKASYTLDSRDPRTSPMWIYGDPTDAVDNNSNIKLREAVPEGWTKQQFVLQAGYHILPETRLTAGYTFKDEHRSNAITHHTQDNQASVKIQSTFLGGMTASLGYVYSDRSASTPDWSLWNVQINSDCGAQNPANLANPANSLFTLGCQQVPFYEAARTQNAVTGMFTAQLGQTAAFSLFGKWNDNQYHGRPALYYTAANGLTVNPSVGINHDYSVQIAPDFTWQPDKLTELHLFYTYMRNYRTMRALNNQGLPGGYYYSEATTYDIHTAGVSASRQFTPKLKLGVDYTYSYGNLAFAQAGTFGSDGGVGDPHLSNTSTNHEVKLYGAYTYSPNLSLYLTYKFDSLDYSDWALVGASAYQVLTGDLPPHYNVSTIIGAVRYKF